MFTMLVHVSSSWTIGHRSAPYHAVYADELVGWLDTLWVWLARLTLQTSKQASCIY